MGVFKTGESVGDWTTPVSCCDWDREMSDRSRTWLDRLAFDRRRTRFAIGPFELIVVRNVWLFFIASVTPHFSPWAKYEINRMLLCFSMTWNHLSYHQVFVIHLPVINKFRWHILMEEVREWYNHQQNLFRRGKTMIVR